MIYNKIWDGFKLGMAKSDSINKLSLWERRGIELERLFYATEKTFMHSEKNHFASFHDRKEAKKVRKKKTSEKHFWQPSAININFGGNSTFCGKKRRDSSIQSTLSEINDGVFKHDMLQRSGAFKNIICDFVTCDK